MSIALIAKKIGMTTICMTRMEQLMLLHYCRDCSNQNMKIIKHG